MFRSACVAALLLFCLPVGEARAEVCALPRIRTVEGCVTRAQILRRTRPEQSRDLAVSQRLRFEAGASCPGSIDRLPRAAAGLDPRREARRIDKVRKTPVRLRGPVYPDKTTSTGFATPPTPRGG